MGILNKVAFTCSPWIVFLFSGAAAATIASRNPHDVECRLDGPLNIGRLFLVRVQKVALIVLRLFSGFRINDRNLDFVESGDSQEIVIADR